MYAIFVILLVRRIHQVKMNQHKASIMFCIEANAEPENNENVGHHNNGGISFDASS